MTKLQQQLQKQFPQFKWQFDFPLAQKTYFKIGGPAEVYLELKDRQKIIDFASFCFAEKIKLTILGGASNVIVADEGVKGVVLHLTADKVEKLESELAQQAAGISRDKNVVRVETAVHSTPNRSTTIVRAEAGAKMSLLVAQTVEMGLTGLEYFLGVPGILGGAVYNNAHYLSELFSEHIKQVEVLNRHGQVKWLPAKDCDFAYDQSRFQKSSELILRVDFLLKPGDKQQSQELIRKATLYRAQTQPLGMPSSGCIFQNVPNNNKLRQRFPRFAEKDHVPAGFLIDQAGLKGAQVGDLEVSSKHAAFMVNLGKGTATDLKKLITKVKQQVKEKFAVELKEEVFYLQ